MCVWRGRGAYGSSSRLSLQWERQGARLSELSSKEELGLDPCHRPPPPTPQHTHHASARRQTQPIIPFQFFSSLNGFSVFASSLPQPHQVPWAPPFMLRIMTLGYGTNNNNNNNYHLESCTPRQPVSFVLHILSYLIFVTAP